VRFNFFRRIRLLPGLWLNVSKRGVSATVGVRGLKTTIGTRGRRTTVGLPGTGMSVSHMHTAKPKPAASSNRALLEKALRGKRRPPN
jgi:hypothetical protein